jgi:hypothetical protein
MNRHFGILLPLVIALVSFSCGQQIKVPFNDEKLTYEGRMLFTPDAAVLSWPGTSVYVNFSGTEIKGEFRDSDTANYYNVILDGQIISKAHFDTARVVYTLAEGLTNTTHRLQLFKRTEWDKGKTFFYGFSGKDLMLLPPSAKPKRRIEFYGNSISCGYAIEDYTNDSPVGFFENNYDAYAAITARHYDAQYQCIAKSGIGITISWFPLLMNEMYDRLDATDPSVKWDFTKYTPDVVVINLLQNDYWLTNMPNNEQFKFRFGTQKPTAAFIIEAYRKFVAMLRGKYPAAKIICMLGNMNVTQEGSVYPDYVKEAVSKLNDKNIFTLFVPYKKTPGHPKTKEQKALADSLIAFIDKNITW